jgi:hypothetical protein
MTAPTNPPDSHAALPCPEGASPQPDPAALPQEWRPNLAGRRFAEKLSRHVLWAQMHRGQCLAGLSLRAIQRWLEALELEERPCDQPLNCKTYTETDYDYPGQSS